jgi:hypothetical protein
MDSRRDLTLTRTNPCAIVGSAVRRRGSAQDTTENQEDVRRMLA